MSSDEEASLLDIKLDDFWKTYGIIRVTLKFVRILNEQHRWQVLCFSREEAPISANTYFTTAIKAAYSAFNFT